MGATGAAGLVPSYDSTGIVSGIKLWVGDVPTDASGNWSANITSAGCTTLKAVQAQAVSADQTAANAMTANVSTRTITTIAGSVTRPQTSTIALAGLVSITVVPTTKVGANVTVSVLAVCR